MTELEKTYLIKHLPTDLFVNKSVAMLDIYLPKDAEHPKLRIRKSGDNYEITKKTRLQEDDASMQREDTISLTEEEFLDFNRLEGKRLEKTRYYYPYQGRTAEIDVFAGKLRGLVLVDFEFTSIQEKNDFTMPDFCLADVTQDNFVAGGILCGKSYKEIEKDLEKYGYEKK